MSAGSRFLDIANGIPNVQVRKLVLDSATAELGRKIKPINIGDPGAGKRLIDASSKGKQS